MSESLQQGAAPDLTESVAVGDLAASTPPEGRPIASRESLLAAYASGERRFADLNLDQCRLGAAELPGIELDRASLVGATLSHAKLDGATLAEADLREAILSDASLARAELARAHLHGADLRRANLTEANFAGASLVEADFSGACLAGACLTGANLSDGTLVEARLEGAKLEGAVLRGADLSGAHLAGADLRTADLRRAVLTRADLSDCDLWEAELAGAELGMADLGGAKLPEKFHGFDSFSKNIDLLSGQGRVLFTTIIGLSAYVLVSAATTTDIELVANNARLKLPVLDAELPIQLFYLGSSVALLGLFGYFHVHLSQQISLMRRLPETFPDGVALGDKVHPWAVTLVVASWMRAEEERKDDESGWLAKVSLGRLAIACSAWGLAPAASFVLLLRFMTSQNNRASYVLWGVSGILLITSVLSFDRARTESRRSLARVARMAMGAIVFAVLLGTLPGVLRATGVFVTNAKYQDISKREGTEWRGAYLEEASLVGADLSGSRLQNAVLRAAILDGAHLPMADLTGADLTAARMEGADLSGATLRRAFLVGTRAKNAKFTDCDARDAHLVRAHLEELRAARCKLDGADLRAARLDGALLDEARLIRANLEGAVLEAAVLKSVDFRGANLGGANLNSAHLEGADLEGADLRLATLVGTEGITAEQLCTAKNWDLTLLPGDEASTMTVPFKVKTEGPLRVQATKLCGVR